MAVQYPMSLSLNSPFLRQFFASTSFFAMGLKGETNPLASFTAMSRFDKNKVGVYEGAFSDAPISVFMINAAAAHIYHDLPQAVRIATNRFAAEEDVAPLSRVAFSIGSGKVEISPGILIQEKYANAKLSVSQMINISSTMGKRAAAVQGEMQLATITGLRGTEGTQMESEVDKMDSVGDSLATMAASPFMAMINDLQTGSTDQKVRPMTSHLAAWDVEGTRAGGAVDLTAATDSADDALDWVKLDKLNTYIQQRGGANPNNPFPFHRASLSGFNADGGKRRMATQAVNSVLCHPEVVERLRNDDRWENYQRALATKLGHNTGLENSDSGLYKGTMVFGFNKIPVVKNAAGVRIAVNVVLGQGALAMMYQAPDASQQGEYTMIKNRSLRKFMETNLPVRIQCWSVAGSKNEEVAVAPMFNAGMVRPNFANGDGDKVDYGVIGFSSAIPTA